MGVAPILIAILHLSNQGLKTYNQKGCHAPLFSGVNIIALVLASAMLYFGSLFSAIFNH